MGGCCTGRRGAITLLFAAFLALFALDVLGTGLDAWRTALALPIHLSPTWILVVVLAVSWRREGIARIALRLLALLGAVWAWDRPFPLWPAFAVIAGPRIVTGVQFLLNWAHRAEL